MTWPTCSSRPDSSPPHLLAGHAHRQLGDQRAANQAAERALALAGPDRLVLPFAMTGSGELLEALPRPVTALRCAGRTPPGRCPGPAAYRTACRGRMDCSGRSPQHHGLKLRWLPGVPSNHGQAGDAGLPRGRDAGQLFRESDACHRSIVTRRSCGNAINRAADPGENGGGLIGPAAIAVARRMAARCCRSGSWRRSGRR